jgi:hypothetical protein
MPFDQILSIKAVPQVTAEIRVALEVALLDRS